MAMHFQMTSSASPDTAAKRKRLDQVAWMLRLRPGLAARIEAGRLGFIRLLVTSDHGNEFMGFFSFKTGTAGHIEAITRNVAFYWQHANTGDLEGPSLAVEQDEQIVMKNCRDSDTVTIDAAVFDVPH
jgi:hypothetical protein